LREMLELHPPLKQGLLGLLDGLEALGLPKAVASSTARAEIERRLAGVDLRDGSRPSAAATRSRAANRRPICSFSPPSDSASARPLASLSRIPKRGWMRLWPQGWQSWWCRTSLNPQRPRALEQRRSFLR